MPLFKKTLITLAILSCILAASWRFWISEYFLALPKDLIYEAELISINNFYDQTRGVYLGQEYHVGFLNISALETTKVGMLVENQFQILSEAESNLFEIKRIYGIDPQTGAHIPGLGDKDRNGYLFAPRDLKPGVGFTYWHVNYDGPAEMEYIGRENRFGVELYIYETYYENARITQNLEETDAQNVSEEWGILLEPHLKIWVEPITGMLMNYEEDTTAYYYEIESGEKLSPWKHFSNTFSEESIKEKVVEVRMGKMWILLHKILLPIAYLLIGGIFLLFAVIKKVPRNEHNFGIHWPIHAFFIFFPIALIMTSWHLLESTINKENELAFENRINTMEDTILTKSDIIMNTLEGIQGLFHASEVVNREEWGKYVQQLNLKEKYPGVQAMGYAPVVWQADIAGHIASMQAEGFLDYAISPNGTRELYTPIMYVEPVSDLNVSLLGFDAFSDELHKEAMNFARNTGSAGMTNKVNFSDELTPSLMIYAPIYKYGLPTSNGAERLTALNGYVFAILGVGEFIEAIFKTTPLGVDFTIYDGSKVSAKKLLYEYRDDPNQAAEESFRTQTQTIHIGGRPWTIKFEGLEEFRADNTEKWLTWGLLWFAMLLCLLHIFIYFTLVSSRDRAMEWIAERSSRFSFKGSKRSTRSERIKR